MRDGYRFEISDYGSKGIVLSYNLCRENKGADQLHTVKLINFRMQENLAVINLKFKQRCQTKGFFVKKMQME